MPPASAEYVRDWTTLMRGERVYAAQDYSYELRGWVETVTENGDVLWLHVEAGAGRMLFSRSGGDSVWRYIEEEVKSVG